MVKKLPATKPKQSPVSHVDVPLPDGRRVLLPMPAYELAVRMALITAQMSDDERQAFSVVAQHTEYSVLKKMEDAPRVSLHEG